MWDKFNIPTFPSETIVFLDGEFRSDLSTAESLDIKASKLPTHIIIQGGAKLPEKITLHKGAKVYLTALITGGKNRIEIDAVGQGAKFSAGIHLTNKDAAEIEIIANHSADNTEIKADIRFNAAHFSQTVANAVANIGANVKGAENSLNFWVLADKGVKHIRLSPNQFISSAPKSAVHGASVERGSPAQITFLKEQGLNSDEANEALREAFLHATFDHLPQ